jgi:N-acetylneuraminic acid mutarotase
MLQRFLTSGRFRVIPALAVAAATLAFARGANGASNWRYEASLSVPRCGAATAGPEGSIFSIGGRAASGPSSVVEVYRPSVRKWVHGPSLPAPREGHAAATGGDGRIYVIGGVVNFTTRSVLALTPGTGAGWTEVAPLSTDRVRGTFGAATGPDGRIYVVGGSDGSDLIQTLEIYDPATNHWTTGAPMPTGREFVAVARGGDGRIYAIGGLAGENALNVVEAYSPKTNSWTKVASLPSRRSGAEATTSLDGLIYVIGGLEETAEGGGPSRRVHVYSPQQNKWWSVPPTQAFHCAAATGRRRIFAVDGFDASGKLIGVVESRPSFCSKCQ